jgi:hypothetical protein
VQLVLLVILLFVIVGLASRTFGERQQATIVTAAVALMLLQLTFSRFL